MIFSRYGTFTGGIDLPDEKQAGLSLPIAPCPPQQRLRVPLDPCGSAPAKLVIAPGRRVRAGDKIADAPDDGRGVAVFAPLAGQIAKVVTVRIAGRDGPVDSQAVELTDLSQPEPLASPDAVFDWRDAEPDALVDRIAAGGLTTHRPGPVPLARWVRLARDKHCRTLIANVMEHQPYVTADHRVLVEHGCDVVHGLAILAKAAGIEDVVIAVDNRRTDAYRALAEAAGNHGISRVALEHKYPTGNDTMLVKVLRRREVPIGADTMAAGVAMTGAATCLAVYRWVACGQRATGRVVTVGGPRIAKPANLWTPFGAECLQLADAESPVIHGGPMVGFGCEADLVVTAATDAVLAIDPPPLLAPTPCIRCGWCTDHCPARLNIAALNDVFELGEIDHASRLDSQACVECGVCSYVCPARLPLTQRVKRIKRAAPVAAGPLEAKAP